jgi:hypothetical protein
LRNAATAATSCSAKDGGDYTLCETPAQLKPFGYNKTKLVTYTNLKHTTTDWAAKTKHNNDTTEYTFDTNGATADQTGQVYCSLNCP